MIPNNILTSCPCDNEQCRVLIYTTQSVREETFVEVAGSELDGFNKRSAEAVSGVRNRRK